MSLELALKETTAAIHQLITALQSSKTLTTVAPPTSLKIVDLPRIKSKGPYYWKSLDGLKTGVVEDSDALQAIIDANEEVEISQKKEDQPCQEKRAFAEAYIKTPYHQRDGLIPQQAVPAVTPEPKTTEPEPDTTALFTQSQELIVKLCAQGQRDEAITILNRFGAAKLAEVPPENLADVVRLAEALLPVLAEE